MSASIRQWLLALLLFAAGAALAASGALQAAASTVPVPPLKARVTDLTGTLNAGQLATLEARLREFERSKGSQIAVLMLPSTQPETIEQYSIRVAEQWKIGRARVDDGVILIVAKNDQKLRIEVGYGLEGAIPDAVAKRVIREVIAPHFLANDFFEGIRDGTETLMKLIEGEKLPPAATRTGAASGPADYQSMFVMLMALVLVAGGVLKAALGRVFGSVATGIVAGLAAWFISGLAVAVLACIAAFVLSLLMGVGGRGYFPGGFGGGGFGGGGGGGFSGGGGGFGGGGASGGWGR
jgi:uncharacterized protein